MAMTTLTTVGEIQIEKSNLIWVEARSHFLSGCGVECRERRVSKMAQLLDVINCVIWRWRWRCITIESESETWVLSIVVCPQAKFVAQIIVTGAQIVGRAFIKAVRQEMQASQTAAKARSQTSGSAAGAKSAAADSLAGISLQVTTSPRFRLTSDTTIVKNWQPLK